MKNIKEERKKDKMNELELENYVKEMIIETIRENSEFEQLIEKENFWQLSLKNDLYLSSLDYIKLIVSLEVALGVEFSQEMIIISAESTLDRMVKYVVQYKKEK